MRHLTSLFELTPDEVREILALAVDLKQKLDEDDRPDLLDNRVLIQLFEKPSLRTRVSFETAIIHLGGTGMFMTCHEAGLDGREALSDVARVISGYADVVVLRTFSQTLIEDFATFSYCPVVNGLSDDFHPCQALADVLTIQETFGELDGKRLVYVGDGNNVAVSLAIVTSMLGMPMTVSTPHGYELDSETLETIKQQFPESDVIHVDDPRQAVHNADVIYTDVWASMGQESESERRKRIFADYQVNTELISAAPDECRLMHCLPAKRGLEVTDDVLESDASIIFQQAENRMHLAKGLFTWLLQD